MPTGGTGGGTAGQAQGSPPYAGHAGGHMPPALVKPISNSHTAQLVRQCLRSFFSTALGCGASQEPGLTQSVANGEAGAGLAISNFTGIPVVLEPNTHMSSSFPTMAPSLVQSAWESKPSARRGLPRDMSPRSYSSSSAQRPRMKPVGDSDQQSSRPQVSSIEEKAERIFGPLEDYIMSSFSSLECINSSFSTTRDHSRIQSESAPGRRHIAHRRRDSAPAPAEPLLSELDPKLLMVGNFAENGTWWIGSQEDYLSPRGSGQRQSGTKSRASHRSLRMDCESLRAWYDMVVHPAQGWREVYEEIISEYSLGKPPPEKLQAFERQLLAGQDHTQKVLGRAIESLLRRPGRPITGPDSFRFLLVALQNPLLRAGSPPRQRRSPQPVPSRRVRGGGRKAPLSEARSVPGLHTDLVKRILGLISQSSTPCHDHLTFWLSRLPRVHFKEISDLVSDFLTRRLARQNNTLPELEIDITAGLIPTLGDGRSVSALHAALEAVPNSADARRKEKEKIQMIYSDDWQVRAASRVMALIFAANNLPTSSRRDASLEARQASGKHEFSVHNADIRARGQILPTSDFYIPLIDSADLVADFEAWEAKRGAFAFCQYPFLLSISAKTEVLEYEARRQMISKARDAFFDSILSRKNINQYWVLDVRRDCLVEDSLKGVSEVIGSGSDDIKKGLRIVFSGEEGIDHGGLRKEWFLLLVREVFNPDNGMFTYEEDSNYCYFNPHCFETSDQFFLVGVVMGLAIYNSTILDIPLPPFAFRKLLATGPSPPPGSAAHPKPTCGYSLDDLAEIRPRLASGLRQLLDYDGNVEETFALNFTIGTEKYGTSVQVPLLPEGEDHAVTNDNRRKYVDLYVRYSLDIAVKRQFEPFKRGFYTVCGGSALTLFRPEEIELLVRGSDEELDIAALRRVAVYENWSTDSPDDGSEPVVQWFWEMFERAPPQDQRRLLLFVTGSDRIPATGPSSLQIKISCMGDDCERFPIARTCFNMLVLWRYSTREKFRKKLWMAAYESEGFGLK